MDTRSGLRNRSNSNPKRNGSSPLNEFRDDEEVAGKPHVADHVELVLQSLPVWLGGLPPPVLGLVRAKNLAFEPVFEPPSRVRPQEVLLAGSRSLAVGRQNGFDGLDHEGAAPSDQHRVVHRVGQVGKQRAHLRAGLEVVLRRQAAALGVRDMRALRDTDQRVVRLVHVGSEEKHLVCGHQGQIERFGKPDHPRFGHRLHVQPVAHQLHVEASRKGLVQHTEKQFSIAVPTFLYETS